MNEGATFPLAKMSPVVSALTGVALSIPMLFAIVTLGGSGPVVPVMAATTVGLVLLYAGGWVWYRPRAFEVTERELRVVWPWRTCAIDRGDVVWPRIITRDDFRREFGWGVRIGVGGLWGAFGWLWTRKRGIIDCYVSRLDGLVLVERRKHHPLLITPERPAELVAALLRAR